MGKNKKRLGHKKDAAPPAKVVEIEDLIDQYDLDSGVVLKLYCQNCKSTIDNDAFYYENVMYHKNKKCETKKAKSSSKTEEEKEAEALEKKNKRQMKKY